MLAGVLLRRLLRGDDWLVKLTIQKKGKSIPTGAVNRDWRGSDGVLGGEQGDGVGRRKW